LTLKVFFSEYLSLDGDLTENSFQELPADYSGFA